MPQEVIIFVDDHAGIVEVVAALVGCANMPPVVVERRIVMPQPERPIRRRQRQHNAPTVEIALYERVKVGRNAGLYALNQEAVMRNISLAGKVPRHLLAIIVPKARS